jgi:hypothetical protein
MEDGQMVMVQIPAILPSVTLLEAAEKVTIESPAVDGKAPVDGSKPLPKFHTGPEVLKVLPCGKV